MSFSFSLVGFLKNFRAAVSFCWDPLSPIPFHPLGTNDAPSGTPGGGPVTAAR